MPIIKCSNKLNLPERDAIARQIFNVQPAGLVELALRIYAWQCNSNPVYADYIHASGCFRRSVHGWQDIPFLPISFFKTHRVTCFHEDPAVVFTSSGTTGQVSSRHYVRDAAWYEQAFMASFAHAYGPPSDYAWYCLLPSYMERSGSSLVYMADAFVRRSSYASSGFFLKGNEALLHALQLSAAQQAPAILLGVTFALLDLAEAWHGLKMEQVIVMETGGMKGRRQEMVRADLHQQLTAAFGCPVIHSEYGMTELMSQAYSKGHGIYHPPPWMKVLVRSEEDPFSVQEQGAGLLCVADLANLDSCAFIETQDVGRVFADGSFEVLGRADNSDIRGCSLLVV
jgi:phenylacetate-coenzyme A ligase PaaK-like adenylate-forming protein